MSFTYTTNYAIPKPAVGTEVDLWGDDYHTGMDIIDARMKLNADAAAAASTLAGTKADSSHTHAFTAITGQVTTTQLTDASVTNAKLATMAINTLKGTNIGGAPFDMSIAQINAMLGGGVSASVAWGAITGTLSAQADLNTALGLKAPLASPTFTGTITAAIANFSGAVSASTAAMGTNTTQVATTAHVYESVTKETQNAQSGSYSLVASDAGKMVTFSGTATVSVNSSVFAAGNRVDFIQLGSGVVTFGGSATRRANPSGANKLTGQYSGATIWFVSASEYVLVGDITA